MPGTTLPANLGRQLNRSSQHIERLERTTVTPVDQNQILPVVFSYPGTVANNTESPPWYASRTHRFSTLRLSLLSASASDLTIALNVNGSTATTLTLPANTTTAKTAFGLTMLDGDYATVKVTAVGTASNATAQLT